MTTEQITLSAFVQALAAYKDSVHVNPVLFIDGNPLCPHCVYFSETPSATGAHRCLIGQVLFDLGVAVDGRVGGARSLIMRLSMEPGNPFVEGDQEAIAILAQHAQSAADNQAKPVEWRSAIRVAAAWNSELAELVT